MPEIIELRPNTPFLLVGTGIELRDDTAAIAFEEGVELVREVRAAHMHMHGQYLECSARTQQGVRNVFDEAILAALGPAPWIPPEETKRCSLL